MYPVANTGILSETTAMPWFTLRVRKSLVFSWPDETSKVSWEFVNPEG